MERAMTGKAMQVGVFILAKNEEANIARNLAALAPTGWPVHVLDSGSTDNTASIVAKFPFAVFQKYHYTNHCNAYNEIIVELGSVYRFVIILDADMIMSEALKNELNELASESGPTWNVLEAKIEMCVEGMPLKYASLYPPKPFLFVPGRVCFVSAGHGEKIVEGLVVARTKNRLRHDDRKPYSSYLQSQYRYSNNLVERYLRGEVTSRDSLRVKLPLLIFAVPFVSYFIKMGFLDGRAGIVYALDRLIAEAIMYRQAVTSRLQQKQD
jgi:glycosyltransferase involved in cell wall biosynthesis